MFRALLTDLGALASSHAFGEPLFPPLRNWGLGKSYPKFFALRKFLDSSTSGGFNS